MATKAELEQRLARLDMEVPQLRRQLSFDLDFWTAFSIKSDVIQRAADAGQIEWVLDSIDEMLQRHGIVVAEDMEPARDWSVD